MCVCNCVRVCVCVCWPQRKLLHFILPFGRMAKFMNFDSHAEAAAVSGRTYAVFIYWHLKFMGLKIYKTLPNQGLAFPDPLPPPRIGILLSLSLWKSRERIEIVLLLQNYSQYEKSTTERPRKLTKLYGKSSVKLLGLPHHTQRHIWHGHPNMYVHIRDLRASA